MPATANHDARLTPPSKGLRRVFKLAGRVVFSCVKRTKKQPLKQTLNPTWWELLYDQLPGICLTLDTTGHLIHVNQFGSQRLGSLPENLKKMPLHALVTTPMEQLSCVWSEWLNSALPPPGKPPLTSHSWHTHLRCQDGSLIPVQVAIQVVCQAQQTVIILLCTEQAESVNDCPTNHPTENPALEVQSSHPEQLLDTLLSQAAVAIIGFRLRPSYRCEYLYCSAGCQRIFGYPTLALMSDPHLWIRCIPLEDRKTTIFPGLRACLAGQPCELEHRFIHPEGSLRWLISEANAIWDEGSAAWVVTVVSRDITEHKLLDLALQQSRAELTYVLDMTTAAIFNMRVLLDGNWTYDYISVGCEKVYGYEAAAHYADVNLWRRILHPDDYPRIISEMMRAIQTEQPITQLFRIFHKDGSIRWITSSYASRWDEGLQCWRVIVVDVDVSDRQHTEAALRQSEARLAEAQQVAQLGSWEYDLVTSHITWSAELYRIYQWDPSIEITFEALLQRFPKTDREQLIQATQKTLATGKPHCLDLSMIRPDGTLCYLEVRGQIMRDTQGNALRLYGTIQDITQRKHLEHQLQWKSQREQLLNQVIRAIRQSLDLDTVFKTATDQTGHLLNLSRAQIAQYLPTQNCWQIHCEYRADEQMPSMQGQHISGQHNSVSDRLMAMETVCIHHTDDLQDPVNQNLAQIAPGSWLLVPFQVDDKLWGSLSIIRNYNEQGWQDWEIELSAAIADQLAIAIQQSELFRQVNHLNGVLEFTVQERTAQLSRSLQHESLVRRITDRVRDSLDEDHILQTAVQELLSELSLECCDAGIYDLENQTSTIAYEATRTVASARNSVVQISEYPHIYSQLFRGISFQFCALKDSKYRKKGLLYTLLVCPIYDDQGSLGDLWLFRPCNQEFDALEVRLVEQVASQCAIALRQSRLYDAAQRQVEELAKLNLLKDDFLSTVSHELRSPMANIKMATEMLEMDLSHTEILTNEKTRSAQYFRILRDECERESNLINDLLDLSRLEADSEPLICHTLDLCDWILHLSEAFVRRTEAHRQHLDFDLPSNVPPLTTDFTFLERILTELLHNACKYTPEGESILVSLRVLSPQMPLTPFHHGDWQLSQTYWEISICNTGTDIPPEEQEKIFDKFYRVPNNDPWRTGGTGLGLALVKKRVERLGGTIGVSSANLRTTFIVKLPCL